jgi:hypothetical protein
VGEGSEVKTYSDGGKDILELVYESNKPGVIDVDAVEVQVSIPRLVPRGCWGLGC